MKQLITIITALLIFHAANAQNDKYVNAMKKNIALIDSIPARNNSQELANTFVRIGDAEKDKWLPYYYAAYSVALEGLLTKNVNDNDALADQAAALLQKATDIMKKDNSEIEVIKSMIATVHLTVDPQSRFMTYGQVSSEALNRAVELDSTNPRPVLFQAQSLFYTPEAFGGGKAAAKPLFERAAKLFKAFKPANDIAPDWGLATLQYFLKMYEN